MDRDQAATIIQAHFRRYCACKEYNKRRSAASKIQDHVSRFLARQRAAKDEEQQQRTERFKAVVRRHQERIQALEHEKHLIQGLPLDELDTLQAQRHAAATTIQAHWRGAQQRQQLRATVPAFGGLRPITCCSPTLPDDPSGLLPARSSSWQLASAQHAQHAPGANLVRTLRQHANSALSAQGPAPEASAAGLAQGGAGLTSSISKWALMPCAEESSWLSAEASKLSAAGGLAQEASSYGQRRAAIPAANRAMLDRQIKTRVDAVSADPSTLCAVRDRQQQTDQRLQQLLQDHRSTEGKRLQAVRRRQRLLQKADMLHSHLKQLPELNQLSDSAWPAQYSLPRPGSIRSERAQQAHALSLGEARVQSKWWTPLKQLNQMYGIWATHAADGAGFLRMQRDWEQEEAAWRGTWAHIQDQEQQRK